MKQNEQTEVLLALHRIEDRLQEIAEILKLGHRISIETAQRQALAGSSVRQRIYELCDGTKSVGEIAKSLGRTIQQVSNNIAILQSAGLVSEARKGREKFYVKSR